MTEFRRPMGLRTVIRIRPIVALHKKIVQFSNARELNHWTLFKFWTKKQFTNTVIIFFNMTAILKRLGHVCDEQIS